MRLWSVLAILGLALVLMAQLNIPDLRGWPPEKGPDDLARIEVTGVMLQPSRPGGQSFKLADCLPRTIGHDVPTAEEYSGTATLVVITCRSRSSAIATIAAYVVMAAAALIGLRALRRRPRPMDRSHPVV